MSQELVCPLDGFENVLFILGGSDGKTYPLCPSSPLCLPYPFSSLSPLHVLPPPTHTPIFT